MNGTPRRSPRGAPPRGAGVPDAPPPRVLLNLTPYDGLASGARERALGLAAALVRRGVDLILAESARDDLASLLAAGAARGLVPRVVRTSLDPAWPLGRALRSARVFADLLAAERPDVFLTDFYPVVRVPGVRTAVTVHDLRWLASPVGRRAARSLYFRTAYGRALRRADLVVTPSAFTRDEVVDRLGVPVRRTAVVPNAVSDTLRLPLDPAAGARVRERLDLPRRPYLLALGVFEERKNLPLLLEALRRLHAGDRPPPPLVLAGRGGPGEPGIRAAARALPPGAVHMAGYVRPVDLPAVYDGARALVHPALYEGFGMPVVEAMARGVPVACARAAALPEAAGGAAALFDPRDPEDCARAVAAVSHDEPLRADLRARGQLRSAGLTYDAVAAALLGAVGVGVGG